MPTNDSSDPDPDPEQGGTEQALRALEERLGRASQAAERLIAEAAGAAARGIAGAGAAEPDADAQDGPPPPRRPPPAGWAPPESGAPPRGGEAKLMQFMRSLRGLIPPDLQRRLAEAVRELLLALRALIDWYLERVEQRRGSPAEVQDIPIL